jgi:perosamine synthetase
VKKTIPLSRPDINAADRRAVQAVLRSPFLALGPVQRRFEREFARYTGAREAICVSSGTAGLHMCIKALDIQQGDEVITTPFSFIASANCILCERAKPVFVDIDRRTLNINCHQIEERISSRTRAILTVHIFGLPCDMQLITRLARRYGLAVIEDACEAIGAKFKGKHVGTLGQLGVFAFYPNKQMTTGEGGMITTNSTRLADLLRSLRNQGRITSSRWLEHVRLGYNYRMDEMSTALGLSQLKRISTLLKKRQTVASWYHQLLEHVQEVETLPAFGDRSRSWFVYVVLLRKGIKRDRVVEKMHRSGIQCGKYFPPIHLQPLYRRQFGYRKGMFPVCEDISRRTLALPFYSSLRKPEVERIVETLKKCTH